eukprot:6842732-Lingulodinium_polyedra.AAC.1
MVAEVAQRAGAGLRGMPTVATGGGRPVGLGDHKVGRRGFDRRVAVAPRGLQRGCRVGAGGRLGGCGRPGR